MSGRMASLRARTIAALMGVALVPAAILASVWYRTAETGFTRSAKSALVASASRAAASIDGFVNGGLAAARTLAQMPGLQNFLVSPSATTRRVAQAVIDILGNSDAPDITSYHLLTPDGRVLLSSDRRGALGARVTDSTVLAAANAVVPLATELRFRSENPQDASFFIAAAVRDRNGQPIGILMAEYESAALDQLVREQVRLAGPQAQGVLYDSYFIRLAGTLSPDALFRTSTTFSDSVSGRLRADRRLRSDAPSGAAGRTTRRVHNVALSALDSTVTADMLQRVGGGPDVRFFVAQAFARTMQWRVSIEVPRNAAIGPTLSRLVRDTVFLALLLTALVTTAAVAIARALTRPLLALTETSQRFASGDLAARVPVGTTDEIGRLGSAFNDLADRVGSLVAGLQQRTKELEADIAQRERLEQELVQTRKLEAVGKLAGGIAHDFNNLLTVVSQNAELAIDEPGLPAAVREALTDIVDAAERGAGLTRQLLTFAKRGASTPRLVDVRAAVLANERLLRQVLGSHIRLHFDLPERALAVFIDATQLEQLFVNLAANARDAMPHGGSLRVWLRDEAATADFPGGCVALEFADSGTGMTPDVALRVFEPFFTTKAASSGTGLGLSTVYGIVTQAGGTIGLESAENEGTTFTLRLPLGAGEAGEVAAPPVPADDVTRRAVILLVEDETAVRHAIARSLRRLGYTVHEAGDGDEGLALGRLHRNRIELLLSDVVMPGADGFVVAATLSQELPGLRVLMMSGYSTDAREHFAGEAPVHRMLEKPFSMSALAAAVSEVLDAPVAG